MWTDQAQRSNRAHHTLATCTHLLEYEGLYNVAQFMYHSIIPVHGPLNFICHFSGLVVCTIKVLHGVFVFSTERLGVAYVFLIVNVTYRMWRNPGNFFFSLYFRCMGYIINAMGSSCRFYLLLMLL